MHVGIGGRKMSIKAIFPLPVAGASQQIDIANVAFTPNFLLFVQQSTEKVEVMQRKCRKSSMAALRSLRML